MSKVLITGGIGFIGYHLARRLLAQGHRVEALDNGRRGRLDDAIADLKASPEYRVIVVDLMDDSATAGLDHDYDHIYHLAAIVGVQNVMDEPYVVLTHNFRLLINAVDLAAHQKALHRFVFASTSEVYAGTLQHFGLPFPTPESAPLTVTDLGHPRAAYMLSKIYGEALCHHAGVPFTIIRPHNVYGPRMGMSHVVPEILSRAHHAPVGSSIVVYSADHKRTFCYVDDAVEMMIGLAASEAGLNQIFNVGSTGDETSIASLGEIILETVGKQQRLEAGPTTEGSPPRRRPDMQRTLSASGYAPRVPLREGIRRTYEWYRDHVFEAE